MLEIALFLVVLLHNCDGQDSEIKTATKCTSTADLPYSYSREKEVKNGLSYWKDISSICKYTSTSKQSPIKLSDSITPDNEAKASFQFIGYDKPMTGLTVNNGAELQLTPKDCVERYIIVNNQRCDLKHITFHFGSKKNVGSDHRVDSKLFPLEVNIAHECPDGDAMVGILYEEVKEDTPRMQPLADAVKLVQYRGDQAPTPRPILLYNLTDENCYDNGQLGDAEFYVYQGSYMFPPCTENVTWIIFKVLSSISTDQMGSFRSLRATTRNSEEQCYLYPNTRYTDNLNGRSITHTTSDCGTTPGFVSQAQGMAFGCNSITGMNAPAGANPDGANPGGANPGGSSPGGMTPGATNPAGDFL